MVRATATIGPARGGYSASKTTLDGRLGIAKRCPTTAVAKERIGLEKDVETERQTVADEVRKERVEVEGDLKEKRKR